MSKNQYCCALIFGTNQKQQRLVCKELGIQDDTFAVVIQLTAVDTCTHWVYIPIFFLFFGLVFTRVNSAGTWKYLFLLSPGKLLKFLKLQCTDNVKQVDARAYDLLFS